MSPIDSPFDSRRRTVFSILTRYFSSSWTVVVAGILALLPAIVWGIPAGHDFANHLKLAIPFHNAIQAGHLHAGWLGGANHRFCGTNLCFYFPPPFFFIAPPRALSGN